MECITRILATVITILMIIILIVTAGHIGLLQQFRALLLQTGSWRYHARFYIQGRGSNHDG